MPYKKKWKEILPATKEILEIKLSKLVNDHLNFKNKNLIFFDLETLGFHPTFEYEQITEIAAKSVNEDNPLEPTHFQYKIVLSSSAKSLISDINSVERYNWEKRQKRRGKTAFTSPNEILEFTKYYENSSKCINEESAIKKFFNFLSELKNPVIIAHNTEFDMNYISVRGKRYNLEMPNVEILDTLKISRFFFIPALKTLSESNEATKILSQLTRHQPTQKKKIHFSSRLGDLASALNIDSTDWHTAGADVEMMHQLLNKMIAFFENNKNLDISKNKEIAFYEVFKKLKTKI
tara:strand:- start:217 stop:1092 length:876 start_codon:yes stop_codon:yes gene_type:complete